MALKDEEEEQWRHDHDRQPREGEALVRGVEVCESCQGELHGERVRVVDEHERFRTGRLPVAPVCTLFTPPSDGAADNRDMTRRGWTDPLDGGQIRP
jgi:hypothetical protein